MSSLRLPWIGEVNGNRPKVFILNNLFNKCSVFINYKLFVIHRFLHTVSHAIPNIATNVVGQKLTFCSL